LNQDSAVRNKLRRRQEIWAKAHDTCGSDTN